MRYILGPLIIIAAIALMKYAVKVADFTGPIDFAEQYLKFPMAGTYSLYRIFGVFMIVLSLMWMFGYFNFLPI